MNIVRGLRERRDASELAAQMMVKVAGECEEKGMKGTAQIAYAAALVQMRQMVQIDQALAIVDKDQGGTIRVQTVKMFCPQCGETGNINASLNVLLSPEASAWEPVACQSCGKSMGRIRSDTDRVPKGYALTVCGVLDVKVDTEMLKERIPEVAAGAMIGPVNAKDLPPIPEMKATLLGENMEPVGVQFGAKPGIDITKKLEAAKAKIRSRVEPRDKDDF